MGQQQHGTAAANGQFRQAIQATEHSSRQHETWVLWCCCEGWWWLQLCRASMRPCMQACTHACRHLVQCIGERVDCCADRLALCVECRGAARCSDGILKSRQRLQHLAQQTCVTQRDCHATARQRMTHIECVTQQQRACAYQGTEVCGLLNWVPQIQSCVRFVLQQGLGSQAAGE